MALPSALPDIYMLFFGYYEPLLTLVGLAATLADPKAVHDQSAPLHAVQSSEPLPLASVVLTIQLAHVCALVGVLNYFLLSAVRKHLVDPALQERILTAYFTPLMVADVAHIWLTLWACGDRKWDFASWTPLLWMTVLLGLSLAIPRVAWHLGVGRYVHRRDGLSREKKSEEPIEPGKSQSQ